MGAVAELKLRLPAALRQKIEVASAKNVRTMNAEIVVRLEESFRSEIVAAAQSGSATVDVNAEQVAVKAADLVLKKLKDEGYI